MELHTVKIIDRFQKQPGFVELRMPTWFNISSLVIFIFVFSSCSSNEQIEQPESKESIQVTNEDAWFVDKKTIQGNAQGTTFTVKTSDDSLLTTPAELSSFFTAFDQELSTYLDTSLISRFNRGEIKNVDLSKTNYFQKSYSVSRAVAEKTNGAFDPTVFPFVKAWGFFKDVENPPNDATIDSIQLFVGFLDDSLLGLSNDERLEKKDPRVKLDFNAIAQGQSVDEIAEMLMHKGQENFYIEVGGEIRTKGVNDRGIAWVIGIDEPSELNDGVSQQRELENYLSISNRAVATSGSYRKFYVKEGQKYSHTIDPKTGSPVQHNLLSVTVVGEDAATCDAYATAFMTMGVEKTLEFIKSNEAPEIEVYMLFQNEAGRIERAYSDGMEAYFWKSE